MAKVVVAEDDVHVLRLMSIWLTRAGHEVLEARNGAEAKVCLDGGDVELLVTDVNMPGCDGIELIRWLRQDMNLVMPVIMLSARCDQARIGERLAGMNVSVHPKPFSPSGLAAEIEGLLGAPEGAASSDE
jgi:DNA-binding response OmpR family regulator